MGAAVDIVIFGKHTPGWTAALSPDALVWNEMSSVRSVLHVEDSGSIGKLAKTSPSAVLVPLMEGHVLARPRGFHTLAPPDEAVVILRNKHLFAQYLQRQGLEHLAPRTFDPAMTADIPVVVKRPELNGGNGIAVALTREDLESILLDGRWRDRDIVVQELVLGMEDFVTHCVCRSGIIHWACTFKYTLPTADTIRGPSTPTKPEWCESQLHILDQIEQILRPLSYDGPCNIDYKVRPDGTLCAFEINPRLGGSLLSHQHVHYLREMFDCIIQNATPDHA